MKMVIHKLKLDVRSKLESGVIITDATQCALELVENALDAKATAIAVRIDLKSFKMQVMDNGTGISPDNLKLIGGRFMTSKLQNIKELNKKLLTYGYRGQALASILDSCSKLSIKTKSALCEDTLLKVFNNGKPLPVSVTSKKKSGTGTTVTVYDFMSTMPVRQKRISEVFDLQDIKNQLEYLALIHNEVCFTLRDENKGEILLQSHKTSDPRFSLSDLFGLALSRFLVPLNFIQEEIEIHGFVSLRRHSECNFQLFYVNKRIVSKSMVHKFVNSLVDKYLKENDAIISESPIQQGINLNILSDIHNVYVVEIQCPYGDFDFFRCLRRTTVEFRNWNHVLNCIKKAIKLALNVKNSSIFEDHATQERNSDHKKFSVNNVMDEGWSKYGLRGVLVKRKGCQNDLLQQKNANEEKKKPTPVKHGGNSWNRKRNSDAKKPFAGTEEKVRAKKSAASNFETVEPVPESPIPAIFKKSIKERLLTCFGDGNEVGDGETRWTFDILIEFAVWLKSKIKNDLAAHNMYDEFVQQKFDVLNRKWESSHRKRKSNDFHVKKDGRNRVKVSSGDEVAHFKSTVPIPIDAKYESAENKNYLTRRSSRNMKKVVTYEKNGKDTIVVEDFVNTENRNRSGMIGVVEWNNKDGVALGSSNSCEINVRTEHSSHGEANSTQGQAGSMQGVFYNCEETDSRDVESWMSHQQKPGNWDVSSEVSITGNAMDSSECRDRKKRTLSKKTKIQDTKFRHLIFGKRRKISNREKFKSYKFVKNVKIQTKFSTCDKGIQTNDDGLNIITPIADTLSVSCEGQYDATVKHSTGTVEEFNIRLGMGPGDEKGPKELIPSETNVSNLGSLFHFSSPALQSKLYKHVDEELITSTELSRRFFEMGVYPESPHDGVCDPQMSNVVKNINSVSKGALVESPLFHTWTRDSNANGVDCPSNNGNSKISSDMLPDTTSPKDAPICNSSNLFSFTCTERYSFVPKGLSQTIPERSPFKGALNNNCNLQRKCNTDDIRFEEKFQQFSSKSCLPSEIIKELEETAEKNLVHCETEFIESTLSKYESDVEMLLNSFKLDKDVLSTAEVIGQWDKKFIVARMTISIPERKELLLLFDQHAVDERIHLEKLMNEFRTSGGEFVSHLCTPPLKLELKKSILHFIRPLENKFTYYGIKISVVDSQHILVHEIPLCLAGEDLGDGEGKTVLADIISDIVVEFNETRGSVSNIPKGLYNLMSTRACKNAVKFNHSLSESEMRKLITDLGQCQTPFACAHGRPSVIPILDLKAFRSQLVQDKGKVNFKKFRKAKDPISVCEIES